MVRPMENTTEMQAMVNGAGDATDNNESQVKGQLISKDTFNCVNSSTILPNLNADICTKLTLKDLCFVLLQFPKNLLWSKFFEQDQKIDF